MARRHWLVLGVGGLILSAASRVTAAGPAQIEPEAYGGSSVGNWTCGPTARANYGGVGGQARFYTDDAVPRRPAEDETNAGAPSDLPPDTARRREAEREAEDTPDLEPNGPSIGLGGGAEYRSFTRIDCNGTPCDPVSDAVPPARMLGAGRANLGYDSDYVGARIGALVFQRWSENTNASPSTYVLPDVEFRFGRRAGFHGGFGFGAYDVSTTFRPGGFLSLGYANGRWAADLRVGGHLVFDDSLGGRGDASIRYGISRGVAPGVGVAVSSASQVTPEGRVFVTFTP